MKKKNTAQKFESPVEPIIINDKAGALLACQKIQQILREYNGMPEDSVYNKLLHGLMEYISRQNAQEKITVMGESKKA
ncbi:hypothetical protein AGMMS49944_05410 [Spirochaetia bacterium]|nr:hypothetical protein AGMMS49944_05410 [Spirochaetia bacterium]